MALTLMLVTIMPVESWHECDHYHVDSTSETQLLEDHQCEICDFHFSGFYLQIPEQVNPPLAEITSQVSLYRSVPAKVLAGSLSSRAPPARS